MQIKTSGNKKEDDEELCDKERVAKLTDSHTFIKSVPREKYTWESRGGGGEGYLN